MTGPSYPLGSGSNPATGASRPRPPIYREAAAILALLAIVVVIGIVDLLLQGQALSISSAIAAWNWVFTVAIVLLVVVIAIWTVRLVFRGLGVSRADRSHGRRRFRYDEQAAEDHQDPAVGILRTRLARGEITAEEYDQTLRKLGKEP